MSNKTKLNEEITKAKDIIESINRYHDISLINKFERPYLHSNEGDFYKNLNLNGKSVITVGSSCDQTLYSLLYGASDVTLFDINPFVYHLYQLKSAAIQNLSMRQTKQLFTIRPINAFKNFSKIVSELAPNMPEDSATFWTEISKDFSHREIIEGLFDRFSVRYPSFLQNEKEYQQLREVLKANPQVNFVQASLENLSSALPQGKTYDVALLSNVLDYYPDHNSYRRDVKSLMPFMKQGGILQVNYSYNYPNVYNNQIHPNKLGEAESIFGVQAINGKIHPHLRDVLPAPVRTNGSLMPAVIKENSIFLETDKLKEAFAKEDNLKMEETENFAGNDEILDLTQNQINAPVEDNQETDIKLHVSTNKACDEEAEFLPG